MSDHSLRLYLTAEHPCGYFPERAAQDLLVDPHDPRVQALYANTLEAGFRRSGGHVYRPRCPGCTACQALRLAVSGFQPNRSQRRCLRDNAELRFAALRRHSSDEHYALYRRYVAARHRHGGMDSGERFDFDAFVQAPWSPTRFAELRDGERLLAVAITDVLPDALSAVYTFFDPDEARRGLGTLCVLRQIEWAQQAGLAHLYLGFFIAGHRKMHYKSHFGPAEVLHQGRWVPFVLPDSSTEDPRR